MKSRVPLFVLAVAVLASGCEDTRTTAPPPQLGDPSKMIFDGAHHGGNPDFFFLPLIGPDARNSPNFDRGKFNATLTPVVKICKLVRPVTGNPTTRLIADVPTSICASGLPFATISDVAVFPTLEFYLAVWKTRNYPVDPDAFYRVQVWVGSKQLGFVDVTVVTSLREAKNAITGEVVPLADDFSLPIPFRIEAGALTGGASSACKGAAGDCVEISVKKAGGTFFTNTKWAGIQLQNGWASDAALALGGGSIVLTIERVPSKDGYCHGGSESEGDPPALGKLYAELGGCYHYATDPDLDDSRLAPADRGFQPPTVNKVGQCTQALPTDEGAADADYLLFKSDPGQPITPLQDTPAPLGLNCTSFAFYQGLPSNPVLRFASIKLHSAAQLVSRFVVNEAYAWDGGLGGILPTKPANALSNISRGVGLYMNRVSTDNQSAPVGGYVGMRVRVTDAHVHIGHEGAESKAGVPVTFLVTAGSGDFGDGISGTSPLHLTTVIKNTDADGYASVPFYVGLGTNTVTATAATLDPSATTFTATGIARGAVSGTVYYNGETPLAGANVTLVSTLIGTLTNSLGGYSLSNVPAGTYTLRVAHPCCTAAERSVVVTAGSTASGDVTLRTLADLVVSSMYTSPATPTDPRQTSYVILVSNLGETDAPASEGTFTEGWSPPPEAPPGGGGSSPIQISVPAIPAGGNSTVTVSVPQSISFGNGTYSGHFTANTGSPRIPESSYTNNSGSASYDIPPVIIGFHSSPLNNVASGMPWLPPLGDKKKGSP